MLFVVVIPVIGIGCVVISISSATVTLPIPEFKGSLIAFPV